MQENISELARKYQEEMLRMYGKRQVSAIPESPSAPAVSHVPPIEAVSEPEVTPLPVSEPAAASPEPLMPDGLSTEPEKRPDLPDPSENLADYGDPELPQYISPLPPQLPEDWTAQSEYENSHTAKGFLRIITSAADSAYPVPDAKVSVFTRIGKVLHLSYLLITDENGETPTVSLPAPPADLSQVPENLRPFASCEIRIAAKGFFRTQANDVHIFAGITTRQVFQLVPLPLNGEASDGDIDPNSVGRSEDCQEGGSEC